MTGIPPVKMFITLITNTFTLICINRNSSGATSFPVSAANGSANQVSWVGCSLSQSAAGESYPRTASLRCR